MILFFNIIYITHAIPVPAVIIWYDFILLATPFILSIFSFIYFYFKKYVYKINLLLFILSILLYFIHYYITKESLIFEQEYVIFFVLWITLYLSYWYKWSNVYNIIIIALLIIISTFLLKIDYNLYKFQVIYQEIKNNIYSNFIIKDIVYKDNFIVIYAYDIETKESWYLIIWIWKEVQHCEKRWIYNICTWWSREVWKWLSILAYKGIK